MTARPWRASEQPPPDPVRPPIPPELPASPDPPDIPTAPIPPEVPTEVGAPGRGA